MGCGCVEEGYGVMKKHILANTCNVVIGIERRQAYFVLALSLIKNISSIGSSNASKQFIPFTLLGKSLLTFWGFH